MTTSQSADPKSFFKCSDCEKTYAQRSQLYIHQTIHIGKEPLSCKICKKDFPNVFTLDLHLQKCSCQLLEPRRYLCTVCRRTYHCASTLALHRYIHFLPRPFACTFCNAAFSTRRTLTRHLQAHNNWEIPQCQLCGLVFSQNSTLHTHEFLLRCVYPHVCKTCGQKFALKAQLWQHKKRHKTMLHGPFKCGLCDKEFFLRQTLIVHWRKHMAGPTFSCYLCPKTFYLKMRLASHLRMHVLNDISEDWKQKKKEKPDVDNAQFHLCSNTDTVSLSANKSKTLNSRCGSKAIPPKVIVASKKSTVDEIQGISKIYRCIPSGENNNIYVEVGADSMPGLEPPQVDTGKMNMTYQQVVSQVKDIVLKTNSNNTTTDIETVKMASPPTATKPAPAPTPLNCNICKKTFVRKASLKVHQQRFHKSPSVDNSINTSMQVVSSKHATINESQLKPNFGPFPYGNSSSMKIIVACSQCGERNFKSLGELEQHVCSELKNKDYTCKICGKHFKFRCRLTTHILKHEHVKPCRVPCL